MERKRLTPRAKSQLTVLVLGVFATDVCVCGRNQISASPRGQRWTKLPAVPLLPLDPLRHFCARVFVRVCDRSPMTHRWQEKEGLTPVISDSTSAARLIIRRNLKAVMWPSEVRLHTLWICILFSPHRPAFYGQIITPARQMELFLNPWHLSFHLVKSPWKDFFERGSKAWKVTGRITFELTNQTRYLLNLTGCYILKVWLCAMRFH